jgi:glucose-6-phosphate isomerase
MLPRINPTTTNAWKQLKQHAEEMKRQSMRGLFQADPERFSKYSVSAGDIFFDYSKNIINKDTMSLLSQLAQECGLADAIKALFAGDAINETEHRAVLHTALRNFSDKEIYAGGENIIPGIEKSREKIKRFCQSVHSGKWRGYTGKRIKYIVNIGIGGSDLGPHMVTEALAPYRKKGIECFFVSNIDGTHIAETLKKIKADRTLFLVASKTFTTQETMTNALTARDWFLDKAKNKKHVARHFVALSTNEKAVTDFGIDKDNMFAFRDWVGGRYSLWSAIGLSIALSTGYKNFEELLEGAAAADAHFRQAAPGNNIPVIMALLGIWYVNFFGTQSEAILPYDQYLHLFPAYMQQGNMESNGKSTDRNGEAIEYSTGPVIWGEPGTNGQHAFFQLLHQGTPLVPCDFIVAAKSHNPIGDHHARLLSNFFAQTEALMNGKSEAEARTELENQGLQPEGIARLLPFRIFPGNKPSNSFLLKKITPYTLGMLIALYEHKIFVQGVIWNIYSFDQWGVELGKQLANKILPELQSREEVKTHDSSTNGLIAIYKKWVE